MKLIAGLGNIGSAYVNTRHNAGFMAINYILKTFNISLDKYNFDCNFNIVNINNQKAIFLEPTTLMNLSGNCISQVIKFFKINPMDLIIIQDDLDLDIGTFKIRTSGSSGGHNGIKDIINKINTDKFIRFKIGIGRPKNKINIADYVLGKFSNQELSSLQAPFKKCLEFIKAIFCLPINKAISQIN